MVNTKQKVKVMVPVEYAHEIDMPRLDRDVRNVVLLERPVRRQALARDLMLDSRLVLARVSTQGIDSYRSRFAGTQFCVRADIGNVEIVIPIMRTDIDITCLG